MNSFFEALKKYKHVKKCLMLADHFFIYENKKGELCVVIPTDNQIERFVDDPKKLYQISHRQNLFGITPDNIAIIFRNLKSFYSEYESRILVMTMNSIIFFWEHPAPVIWKKITERRRKVKPRDPSKEVLYFGEHIGKTLSQVPIEYLFFLSRIFEDPYLAATAFMEYENRKLKRRWVNARKSKTKNEQKTNSRTEKI